VNIPFFEIPSDNFSTFKQMDFGGAEDNTNSKHRWKKE
jgi:hypothetical protein